MLSDNIIEKRKIVQAYVSGGPIWLQIFFINYKYYSGETDSAVSKDSTVATSTGQAEVVNKRGRKRGRKVSFYTAKRGRPTTRKG